MRILLFNGKSLRTRPLWKWFSGTDAELVVLSPESARDGLSDVKLNEHYKEVHFFPDYLNGEPEYIAQAIHRKAQFDRIVSLSERDIIRAANLRSRWKLAGQTMESAIAFRDKLIMKTLVSEAGVRVPPMSGVDSSLDILCFAQTYGYPIVIKPRCGSGSVDVRILHSHDELIQYLLSHESLLAPANFQNTLIEKYIDGRLYHVDGIMKSGHVLCMFPSRYLSGNISVVDGLSNLAGFMLDQDASEYHALCDIVRRTIAALPCPEVNTSFHAEVFREHGSGMFYLCEVASRSGGGGIVDMIEAGWGCNLNMHSLLGQAGLRDTIEVKSNPTMCGYLCYAARQGIFADAPEECRLPGVFNYRIAARFGSTFNGPRTCVDGVVLATISGKNSKQVLERIQSLEHWLDERIVWQ